MATTNWSVDLMHSDVQFKVKHLVISTVSGAFKTFAGEATTEGDGFDNASINFSIEAESVDTNQEMRDGHLKNADFFDVEKYPIINFKSTSFTKTSGADYKLVGDLTIKDVTKPVELAVEYGGTEKD